MILMWWKTDGGRGDTVCQKEVNKKGTGCPQLSTVVCDPPIIKSSKRKERINMYIGSMLNN